MLKERVPTRHSHLQHYRRLSSLWLSQGIGQSCNHFPRDRKLLQFTTNSGWHGLIDVVAWFSSVQPDLAAQASEAWPLEKLAELFGNSQHPQSLEALPEMLHYDRLEVQGLVEPEAQGITCYHVFPGGYGNIWFCGMDTLPEIENNELRCSAASIPVTLNFRIGISRLSVNGLNNIAIGDALLIQQQVSDLVIANQKIGNFIQHEEGYMFAEMEQDTEIKMEEQDMSGMSHVGQTPVVLDFIFQQKTITVGELEAVYQGAIIKCDQQAPQNIIVRANGLAIARGQLVWFDDQPAVEISHLHQEVSRGER